MKHRLDHRVLPDGRILLEINGRTTTAVTARDGSATWVFLDGRSWRIDDPGQTPARRARGGRDDLGDVTPPMPAAVVRVLVEPGDAVALGQGLVVISAMKMETTLVSAHPGVVAKIRVAVGDKVAPGDVLVDVTPDETSGDAPSEET
jgi:3-methylcrotonyl-CoA carboxylase alpha subunit